MLASFKLATSHGPRCSWAVSTVGIVDAVSLAIIVGAQLGARLPERAIRIGATLAFVAFGLLLIVEGVRS
jgi:putative Ca2+/H+ antiporter (TMEM165/GDT1 family)